MGGATLAELAARYTITETSAAMRLAEEELTSGVDVVTPTRVHRRGAVPWTLTQARAKVLKRAPSGAIRLEIGDEPGRAALLPKRTG
jgi:hypothetical protein